MVRKGKRQIGDVSDWSEQEFFFPMLYLAENGFTVYLFVGPGQGGVMRVQGKHFTHKWEKPVKTVLDYFKLDDVTIIGASLGGMLAPRAAAFEKRIKRVIAWSIFPNFKLDSVCLPVTCGAFLLIAPALFLLAADIWRGKTFLAKSALLFVPVVPEAVIMLISMIMPPSPFSYGLYTFNMNGGMLVWFMYLLAANRKGG